MPDLNQNKTHKYLRCVQELPRSVQNGLFYEIPFMVAALMRQRRFYHYYCNQMEELCQETLLTTAGYWFHRGIQKITLYNSILMFKILILTEVSIPRLWTVHFPRIRQQKTYKDSKAFSSYEKARRKVSNMLSA